MNKISKTKCIAIYNIMLPILALVSLFMLMSTGDNHFHICKQSPLMIVINAFIYMFFLFDFLARINVAKNKKHFLTTHLAEFISVLPITPLIFIVDLCVSFNINFLPRAIYVLLFFIVFFAYLVRAFMMQRHYFKTNQLHYALAISMTALVVSANLFSGFEGKSYSDSIWWAFVTATTTGYGDIVPVTDAGRVVGIFMMIVGVAIISMLTGLIAKMFLQEGENRTTKNKHVKTIIQQLSQFETLSVNDVDEICEILKTIKSHNPEPVKYETVKEEAPIIPFNRKFLNYAKQHLNPSSSEETLLDEKIIEKLLSFIKTHVIEKYREFRKKRAEKARLKKIAIKEQVIDQIEEINDISEGKFGSTVIATDNSSENDVKSKDSSNAKEIDIK